MKAQSLIFKTGHENISFLTFFWNLLHLFQLRLIVLHLASTFYRSFGVLLVEQVFECLDVLDTNVVGVRLEYLYSHITDHFHLRTTAAYMPKKPQIRVIL